MAIRVIFNPLYVFYFLLSNFLWLQKLGLGSTVPGIDRESILNINFPLAPLKEQELIVSEISEKFSLIDNISKLIVNNIKYGGNLRRSILKEAFEGKLVPQDRNDEPAEIILQRIKQDKAKSEIHSNPKKTKIKDDDKQMRLF